MAWLHGTAAPKPEKRSTAKNRSRRLLRDKRAAVREYVFGRERSLCRCCRIRPAESMHELRFRSLGGKVSRQNSIAVCGDGVRGCHGHLQRLEIEFQFTNHINGAEAAIEFRPRIQKAADHMRVKLHEWILSDTMIAMESV
jgi:hypothetical protein